MSVTKEKIRLSSQYRRVELQTKHYPRIPIVSIVAREMPHQSGWKTQGNSSTASTLMKLICNDIVW